MITTHQSGLTWKQTLVLIADGAVISTKTVNLLLSWQLRPLSQVKKWAFMPAHTCGIKLWVGLTDAPSSQLCHFGMLITMAFLVLPILSHLEDGLSLM